MKISQKLIATFGVLSLLVLAVGLTSLNIQDALIKNFHRYSGKILPGTIAAARIEADLYSAEKFATEYALTMQSKYAEKSRDSLHDLAKHMIEHRVWHAGYDELEFLEMTENIAEAFTSYTMEYLLLVDKGGSKKELRVVKEKMDNEIYNFASLIHPHNMQEIRKAKEREQALWIEHRKARTIILGAIGLGFIIAAILGFMSFYSISRPIKRLIKSVKIIGLGKLDTEIDPKTRKSKDEIGNLASAFSKMTEDLNKTTVSRDALAKEIDERKKTEEALRESEERYRSLIETITDLVFIIAPNGNLTYLNPEFEKITGYPVQDFMGHSFTEILAPECIESTVDRFKQGLSGETIPIYKVELLHKDGKTVSVELKVTSLLDDGGNAIGRIGVARDISDQKKIQEEVLKARKLESLGTLAGGIAHDFNNLLSVIMGNISLAEADIKLEVGPSKNLKKAEKASIKAKELTARLITFSRGGDPVKEVTPIGGLVKDSVRSTLSDSGIDYEISIPDDLLHVEIDKQQIKQVIRNITINAQEAMAGKGTIKVYCEVVTIGEKDALHLKDGEYVKISIEDQGPGIPEENLKKIFDPYFSTKGMGTDKGQGLGLSVCHSIVKKHDGLVTVESELGVGTTFIIYLPASEKKIAEPEHIKKSVQERPVTGKGKILVMDDEEMIRDLSNQILTRLGYDTEVCKDGSEAIRMYEKARESEEPFDAVILDLTNELGMGGKEAMQRLLEIDPEVKGIVATGYSNDPVVTKFREYGFCGALPKPYTMDELSMTLYDVISGEPYRMEGQISDVHKSAYDNERTSEKKR